MRYLLNGFYLLLLAVTLPYWLYQSASTGKYRVGLWRKLIGAPPAIPGGRPVVWFHAVSVGEVLLIGRLLDRFGAEHPGHAIVLSTTTNTGYELAKSKYPTTPVFYAPLDFTWSVGRVFDGLRPSLLVLVELELWPNLLREAARRNIPVAVVNARLGERSYRGYRRFAWFFRPVLAGVRWWGAQTSVHAERIGELIGPAAGAVEVTGSMKYDGAARDRAQPRTAALGRLFGLGPDDIVFVAGSTQAPEEEIVLDAFAELTNDHPRLRVLLVPRHAERFDEVARLLRRRGVDFVRRSELTEPRARMPMVTLVDTIGELSFVWGLADVGFVGGSLECRRGGQSMIEPAGFGVPTCFGPGVWNFRETVDRLLDVGGAAQVQTRADLIAVLRRWLDDPAEAARVGRNAQRFIASQQGAVEATAAALAAVLEKSIRPRRVA